MNFERICYLIRKERKRQDAKWGRSFPGRPQEKWLAILAEEFGEVARAILEHDSEEHLREEIIQTAAVCASWLEQHDWSDGA